jgi:hypothetical protein
VSNAAGSLVGTAVSKTKKDAGVNSPSTVFAQIGSDMSAGLGLGLANASSSIQGVASNSGLMVGYVWGQSVVSGALSVIKSSDFATASVSGVGSALAETALGQLGALGPAGSGGQISKTPAVTLSSSSASSQQQVTIQNHLSIDGAEVKLIAGQEVTAQLEGLTHAISMQ